ncbi:MAG: sulfatase [Spirosomataceae bacterium]
MKLLRFFSFCCLVLSLSTCQRTGSSQPNILFILADDWSYPFASVFGTKYLQTPNLEKLAAEGVVFENAYCSSPSCTPSRASILTGRYPHNLGEGVNLCGRLDVSVPTYVKLMREKGYAVAFDRKGWAPGDFKKMGYTENPCGERSEFGAFLGKLKPTEPFFFWFGTHDPHRPFDKGSGQRMGIDLKKIKVPAFLPDTPEIRGDLADYFAEIERFDREIGALIEQLRSTGRLENTIIVVASDNGMPFPHAKANLYDYGTRVPLIISSFSDAVAKKVRNTSFVNLMDLTPTFLDLVGIQKQPPMDGISLMPVLKGEKTTHRSEIYLERERHCLCRAEMDYGAGYPMRAVRTNEFLYIQNFRPNRMPAGDATIPNTPSEYGDVDGGPTKVYMMDQRNALSVKPLFEMGFGKRPAEELYDVKADPSNIHNLANLPQYASTKKQLNERLYQWMKTQKDPRLNGGGDEVDRYKSTTRAWITKTDIILLDEPPLKP